jgi:hypothetical protein
LCYHLIPKVGKFGIKGKSDGESPKVTTTSNVAWGTCDLIDVGSNGTTQTTTPKT